MDTSDPNPSTFWADATADPYPAPELTLDAVSYPNPRTFADDTADWYLPTPLTEDTADPPPKPLTEDTADPNPLLLCAEDTADPKLPKFWAEDTADPNLPKPLS